MATYYVKNGGNDALSGLDDTNAWETIAKVNGFTFASGDVINWAKGSIWREMLIVPRSGTAGNYMKFKSYGTGAQPQILGSNIATTWTDQTGNKWKTDGTYLNPRASYTADLLFMKAGTIHWGAYKANTGLLVAEYDWTWSGNYVYVYSTTNPASAYTWVEIPQRWNCIDLNNQQYVEIDNIDILYSTMGGITYKYSASVNARSGVIIDGCNISYLGGEIADGIGYGIDLQYSDMIIRNCEIHHCGRRSISLDIYGDGFTATNCLIENNYFHDGYHTTGVDIKSGNGYTGGWDGITIRRNKFWDPVDSPYGTEHIWCQYGGGATLQNVYIYSNIFINAPSGHACIHTMGVDSTHGVTNLFVYNNVFYEHSTPTTATCSFIWLHCTIGAKIKNNIFFSTKASDNNGSAVMIFCHSQATQPYTNIDSNYNLYWTTNASARIIYANNTYYNKTQFATWKAALSWDANSPTPASPLFISTTDYRLQVGSPAIHTGVYLSGTVLLDYASQNFSNPPSIGAYEVAVVIAISILKSNLKHWSII